MRPKAATFSCCNLRGAHALPAAPAGGRWRWFSLLRLFWSCFIAGRARPPTLAFLFFYKLGQKTPGLLSPGMNGRPERSEGKFALPGRQKPRALARGSSLLFFFCRCSTPFFRSYILHFLSLCFIIEHHADGHEAHHQHTGHFFPEAPGDVYEYVRDEDPCPAVAEERRGPSGAAAHVF